MRALTPAEVLFDGEVPPAVLPACDHYAGSEKLMLKSLALQQQLGPVFDITLDCEDGAQVGREAEHAELVASLIGSEHDRFGRVGVRIHDFAHPHWRDDVRLILRAARQAPAYITLLKIRSVHDAAEMVAFIEATRRELGVARPVPVQLLVETHGALTRVFDLAALPGVEALSFGLVDFVSAHDGAIPDTAMRSPGQFDHPLVRRAKLEISAACHAHGKVPSHNVSTEVRDMSVVANDAPRDEEIATATEILLAAQSAQWGPTRHRDTLHNRASYRYYWSVLRRAQSTGRTIPQDAAPLFAGSEAMSTQRGDSGR
ncbi:MAG: Similar to citrate lyase beta chain, 10 [uncultured Paraburkholderia sp.]|nr:MAG: Similar to citrate lyase beta chain, 10 [uncultured Paraburkholderia sp.]CAH2942237.1 MAG: Similar to citrate lyase beta chain, 10 [uncultured Paraburkholderia sp.]